MLRFGKISAIKADAALYQVTFDEDQLVSGWLPALVRNTKLNKHEAGFDEGEHVACLMDEGCELGVILGAIYDETNAPEEGNADVWQKKFSDGTFIKYDRGASELTIDTAGKVNITAADEITINGGENDGLVKVKELTEKLNALEQNWKGLIDLLTSPTVWVPVASDGGAALKVAAAAQITAQQIKVLTPTQETEIQNPDVKH